MRQDIEQATLRALEAYANLRGARVLEIGCGTGRVTAMVADRARFLVGLEPARESVREARRSVPGAHFVQGSGAGLPFGPDRFDVVLFSLSLHHHPSPGAALVEAERVLVPGGRLLVVEPEPDGEIQLLCNIFENEDHRLERAAQALEKTGLRTMADQVFSTLWVFDDWGDVKRYVFEYYRHPTDSAEGTAREAAMKEFLGAKIKDAPVNMTDTLRLIALT